MDAVASVVFPHLGFGGWKEHYTANSPAWRLSYALPLWAKGVERVWGWGVQKLFRLPPNFLIPFFEADDVQAMMKQVVEQTIGEQGWGPILEAVREHTSGKGKGALAKIIYIADKIDPGRGYDIRRQKEVCLRDLDEGFALIRKEQQEYLRKEGFDL